MSNEIEVLGEKSLTLLEQALTLAVVDQKSYESAGELGSALKNLETQIITYHKPIKQAIDVTKKTALDREKADLAPVQEALAAVRQNVNGYLAEQARKDREEQARRQREEVERAEKERQRLLAQAVKAEEKGKDEKAEALLERAENVYLAPVIVAPTVQTKTDNTSAAMDTEIAVVDLKAFITELVKRNMAPTMMEVKTAPLKSWVNANAFESFPGLNIKKVPKVRFR